ncbi:putative dehydrogenase [Litorimonas taeanensis]|uniref:Putative dehydrogenase n=1 Tax=Litorimonas taeanensis TaxID=568099 RepID=A0A420WKD0_9PROT|nr:Gfo/Idh/MocA family oxidoreductase [Litorimonas taeanensis]RKQ71511.1 putative dehydrogenase [Litorimonas taeanensis]
MTQKRLKVGLLGAGVFGGYHAGKLASHPKVTFVGVYDPNPEKRQELAEKYGTIDFKTEEALFSVCDAIILANPAVNHGPSAINALKSDCHVLIEKPMATSIKDAEEILSLSKGRNRVVQVGHQERYVIRAIGLDKVDETPQKIVGIRKSTFSRRGGDTSVTLDLMTHDIDLCCMLMRDIPHSISGTSETVNTPRPDRARAELTYKSGSAILTASRVADEVGRQMTIQYPSGTVLIDFGKKTLQHNTPFKLDTNFGDNPSAKDSLGAATEQFISAVLEGSPVSVTAKDGYEAARIAINIDGREFE